jgi:hypothetical protein
MSSYRQGTLVTVQATFTAEGASSPSNPSAVSLTYTDPSGEQGPFTPTNTAAGIYTYDIDTTPFAGGSVLYKFTATGAIQVVGLGSFKIIGNPF